MIYYYIFLGLLILIGAGTYYYYNYYNNQVSPDRTYYSIISGLPYYKVGLTLEKQEVLSLYNGTNKDRIREIIKVIIKARDLELKDFELKDFKSLLYSAYDIKEFTNAILEAERLKFNVTFEELDTYHRLGGDVFKYVRFLSRAEREGLKIRENEENMKLVKRIMKINLATKQETTFLLIQNIAKANKVKCKIDLDYLFSNYIETGVMIELIICAIKAHKEKVFNFINHTDVKFEPLSISLENFLELIALEKDFNLFTNILIKARKSKIDISLQMLLEFDFIKGDINQLFNLLVKAQNANLKIIYKAENVEHDLCLEYLQGFYLIGGNIEKLVNALIFIKKNNIKHLTQKRLESYFLWGGNMEEITEAIGIYQNLYPEKDEDAFLILKNLAEQKVSPLSLMKGLEKAKSLGIVLAFDYGVDISLTDNDLYQEVCNSVEPITLKADKIDVVTKDGFKISLGINIIVFNNIKNFFSEFGEAFVIQKVKNALIAEVTDDVTQEDLLKRTNHITQEVLNKLNIAQQKETSKDDYIKNENGIYLRNTFAKDISFHQINQQSIYRVDNIIIRDIKIISDIFEDTRIRYENQRAITEERSFESKIKKAILEGNKEVTDEYYKSLLFNKNKKIT